MLPIATNKDIHQTKVWLQEQHLNKFGNINDPFIKFLERSGERDCPCKNAVPVFYNKILSSGEAIPQIKCSVCGGKFYKYGDFHFKALVLGRTGGGKTTFVFAYADLLHSIDPHRKIRIWQCPPHLISILHNLKICQYYKNVCERVMGEMKWQKSNPLYKSPDEEQKFVTITTKSGKTFQKAVMLPYQEKEECHRICKFTDIKTSEDCQKCPHCTIGKHYIDRIDRLDEINYNDIIILDEGIISVNAKEALSKKMRAWDKFLAVIRHKRACLFVLFQRFEIIKTLREMCDIMFYKSLSPKFIESEKYDQIIKKYGERIVKLERGETLVASSHQDFDRMGIVYNRVPYWYTDEVSMSYIGDTSFLSDKGENENQINRAKKLAKWIIDQNLPPISKPNEKLGIRFKLREAFKDEQPPITEKELSKAIEAYYAMTLLDGVNTSTEEAFRDNAINNEENIQFFEEIKKGNITEKELTVYDEFCKGKSVTEFDQEPYNLPKQRVTEVVRKVGSYYKQLLMQKTVRMKSDREGEESERKVVRDIWDQKGYGVRAVGSGGDRNIPSPDVFEITKDGEIRIVQVKERGEANKTFNPLTFNAELKVINRLRNIAKTTSVHCMHCGEPVKGVLKVDKAYLYAIPKDRSFVIKEPLELPDNKLTLKINWEKKQIIRQPPDLIKIKTPKLLEFLNGKEMLYYGTEELAIESDEIDETKQNEIVNLDKLIEETGLKDDIMPTPEVAENS